MGAVLIAVLRTWGAPGWKVRVRRGVAMNEPWVMLIVGVLVVVFGLVMTDVSGPMPGAKP